MRHVNASQRLSQIQSVAEHQRWCSKMRIRMQFAAPTCLKMRNGAGPGRAATRAVVDTGVPGSCEFGRNSSNWLEGRDQESCKRRMNLCAPVLCAFSFQLRVRRKNPSPGNNLHFESHRTDDATARQPVRAGAPRHSRGRAATAYARARRRSRSACHQHRPRDDRGR